VIGCGLKILQWVHFVPTYDEWFNETKGMTDISRKIQLARALKGPVRAIGLWNPMNCYVVWKFSENIAGGAHGRQCVQFLRQTDSHRRALHEARRLMLVCLVFAGLLSEPAQTDKGYEITAELPGMEEKDIDVKLSNGILTIRGEKRDEKEEKKQNYYMRERSFGSFERSFQVPEDVDVNKIGASFKKGVLTLMLPKSAEAQKAEKKIEIKAG
jgi:HSP20 family molecular chaperone IbpA